MKILVNKKDTLDCYVQIKDLFYLGNKLNNKELIDLYWKYVNENSSSNNFILLSDNFIKECVINCEDIIDFTQYYYQSVECLSRSLVNLNFGTLLNSDDGIEYKSDGIRDVIAFKRGELSYKIPLVCDGRICYEDDELGFSFKSTIISDYYIFSAKDMNMKGGAEYNKFLEAAIDSLFKEEYPHISDDEKKYDCFDKDGDVIVVIKNIPKKTIGNVLKKILSNRK